MDEKMDGGMLVSLGDGMAVRQFERALRAVEDSYADPDLPRDEKREITLKFVFAGRSSGLIDVGVTSKVKVPYAQAESAVAQMVGDTLANVDLPKQPGLPVAGMQQVQPAGQSQQAAGLPPPAASTGLPSTPVN